MDTNPCVFFCKTNANVPRFIVSPKAYADALSNCLKQRRKSPESSIPWPTVGWLLCVVEFRFRNYNFPLQHQAPACQPDFRFEQDLATVLQKTPV